jgi:hypothetical protein
LGLRFLGFARNDNIFRSELQLVLFVPMFVSFVFMFV